MKKQIKPKTKKTVTTKEITLRAFQTAYESHKKQKAPVKGAKAKG
jgi:hypothetical protein